MEWASTFATPIPGWWSTTQSATFDMSDNPKRTRNGGSSRSSRHDTFQALSTLFFFLFSLQMITYTSLIGSRLCLNHFGSSDDPKRTPRRAESPRNGGSSRSSRHKTFQALGTFFFCSLSFIYSTNRILFGPVLPLKRKCGKALVY